MRTEFVVVAFFLGAIVGSLLMFERKEHLAHKLAICEAATEPGPSPERFEVVDNWKLSVQGGRIVITSEAPDSGYVSCQVDLSRESAGRVARALDAYATP
jgi:hypothetical protein